MAGCVALIVAAGRGSRFGGELPKQYRRLGGVPMLRHCLETFRRHPGVSDVRVVIHPDDRARYDEAADGLGLLPPVAGRRRAPGLGAARPREVSKASRPTAC